MSTLSREDFLRFSGGALMGALSGFNLPGSVGDTSAGLGALAGGTSFEVEVRRLSLKHTWTISRNSSDFKDNVFVRIARDGVTGLGEAAPNVRYGEDAAKTTERIQRARQLFESSDWFHYVDVKDKLDGLIKDQSCAKAALDIALLDWVGRRLNAPLYRLFGLDRERTPITTMSIGIDTPEVIRQKIAEAADFPVLKIKVGRDDDAQILDSVRRVTDKPLRVDANEGWKTKEVALEKIRWLRGLGVELIEQPLPSVMLEETRWLRERVDLPIIADEAVKTAADIPALAECYDGINIKLMKAGGVQEALNMIRMARALGLKVMLGCMVETSVAIAAAAHLSPLADFADLDGNLLISNDPFRGPQVVKGKLILPDRPGLGVEAR
jgi:L-alanine-DL-glutamate epimerase-like enolase superfamily enzyme